MPVFRCYDGLSVNGVETERRVWYNIKKDV